jgi:fumarylacetoacetase
MNHDIDETHDPARRSWVESANATGSDFPIQNLPFCVFGTKNGEARGGVGIGSMVLDLRALSSLGLLHGEAAQACQLAAQPSLNALMALPPSATASLRRELSALLATTSAGQSAVRPCLVAMDDAQFQLPARIGGYTDFLCSQYHTERNMRLKGSKDPLPAAFFSLPVAYNGRVSSMRVSGTNPIRPLGQFRDAAGKVVYGPARALDFELEMGAFVRGGNALGQPVGIAAADDHIFGLTLFNDWSAKDIQWWEQILGPFLGKSFHTSVSPWVVTLEALAPFRVAHVTPGNGNRNVLPYLLDERDQAGGMFDVAMTAALRTERMRREGEPARQISATNLRHLNWTFAQMLAHHTSNGCNLEAGDFCGSGTVSGQDIASAAGMTELASAGQQPIRVSAHEERGWLQDGDEVIFHARAQKDGFIPIGFGECRGIVLPAIA